jgi:pimeloyl-ACP methyl ester carboxylesterase
MWWISPEQTQQACRPRLCPRNLGSERHDELNPKPATRTITASTLAAVLLLAGCATQPSVAPGPLGLAQTKLAEARLLTKPTETRITDYFEAAEIAEHQAETQSSDAAIKQQATQLYNDAAAEGTVLLEEADGGKYWNHSEHIGSYEVRFQPGGNNGFWSPGFFDQLKKTNDSDHKHLRIWVHGPGFGGTLVGFRKGRSDDPFAPKVGYVCPVTTTLDYSSQQRTQGSAHIVFVGLHDPTFQQTVRLGSTTQPLAYDLSAPLGHYPRANAAVLAVRGLLRADKITQRTGLYMVEPYDPNRIPIILVHGLISTPHMWFNIMNAVRADPKLRTRYQFWVFYYPTANPILFSAWALRNDLAAAERLYHPQHGIVLVGHSMGGLVSRMQAVDTGRVLWNGVFGQNADALYAKIPDDHLIKQALVFQADPNVKRIVFICVPHRGSSLAVGLVGMLGNGLIRVPQNVLVTLRSAVGNSFQQLTGIKTPTSIRGLSPHSPVLIALDKLPIKAPHHSIIGDRGRGDSPNGSDGVVPYRSAHLDSAQSEKIIPYGHGGYQSPESIDELLRILRLHAGLKPEPMRTVALSQ